MSYYGDIRLGATIDIKFSTVNTSAVPTTLAGSPAIAAYPDNSTSEITAGITLTVDFDSRTGYHNVRIVATSGNTYATGTNYSLCLTAGTVGGTSVVGMQIGSFSIENRSALMPTTSGRTLDVSSGGESGLDWANIGSPTTSVNLSGTSTKAVEPTVAGRTLDVSVGGEAGMDWGNVGSPTTTVGLTNTTISTTQAVASVAAGVTVGTNNDKTGYALTSGERDSVADALLKRDWTSVTGEAARSVLNALRFLRNKWDITSGTLTVKKEDDSTTAWTGAVTTTAGNPVSTIDPT